MLGSLRTGSTIFGLEFPPIENIVEWPNRFGEDTPFAFNKIALIIDSSPWSSRRCCSSWPGRKPSWSSRRASRTSSSPSVDFIEKRRHPARPSAPDGMRYLPYAGLDVLLHLHRQPVRGHPDGSTCRPTPAWPTR